jgi:iron complex outermembrane receptor protein
VPRRVGGVICNCGNVAATLDVTGNRLIRSPDYSFTVGATYRKELAAGALELSGSVYYSGDYVFTSDERIRQDAYENVTARIAFEPAGTKLRLSLWGRNLTDATVIEGTSILPNGDGVWYASPRTYGVQLDYQF